MNARIDLVKAFIQLESGVDLIHTTFNYDKDGGIEFSGNGENGRITFTIVKDQVNSINECKTIEDVLSFYNEMEYFQSL